MNIEVLYKENFPEVGYYTKEENKEEFITNLRYRVEMIIEKYNERKGDEYVANRAKYLIEQLTTYMEKTRNEAQTKYKTQKKIDEYYNKKVAEYVENIGRLDEVPAWVGISFFDFYVEPWSNVSHNCSSISIHDLSNDKLEHCWKFLKDNKYFKKAIGWQFETGSGRPEIRLILPKEIQKEFDNEAKNLGESIDNFYKNTKYWGD